MDKAVRKLLEDMWSRDLRWEDVTYHAQRLGLTVTREQWETVWSEEEAKFADWCRSFNN